MIIFDLEWNSGQSESVSLDEILQIGAVRCTRPGGTVEDTFCVYIHPEVHHHLSPAAESLPGLPDALSSPLRFPDAVRKFFAWCAGEGVFAAWGSNDFPALAENLRYWNLGEWEAHLPKTYLDLQLAFGDSVNAGKAVSLEQAVEYCQIPDIFDPHDALSDAIYAWAVCMYISDSALEEATRPWRAHRRHIHLPKRASPWKGPFSNVEDLLNSRGCRRTACPTCGEKSTVMRWLYRGNGPYYARVVCPRHGSQLWRLETIRDRKGQIWANGAFVSWNSKWKAAFRNPTGFQSVACQSRRQRRKK